MKRPLKTVDGRAILACDDIETILAALDAASRDKMRESLKCGPHELDVRLKSVRRRMDDAMRKGWKL